jgi:hypothetical protein
MNINSTIFIAIKATDLDELVPPDSVRMFTGQSDDVDIGDDITVNELFKTFNDEAGYFRERDGVLHKCFPMFHRKFTGFEPPVLEIHDQLSDFGFDEILIEEGN